MCEGLNHSAEVSHIHTFKTMNGHQVKAAAI